jgi:CHAT domain-containing protein
MAQEAIRTSFLRDKAVAYDDLVRLHLAKGGAEGARRAFAVADRAKSRTLVEMQSGLVEPVDSDLDEKIHVQLAKAESDLNVVYNEWLGGSGHMGASEATPELQARAVELEQEISLLRLRAARRKAHRPFETQVGVDDIQSGMSPGEAIVAYHVVGDEILAFVVAETEVLAVPAVSTVGEVRTLLQRLDSQWDRFRAGTEFVERHIDTLRLSTDRLLELLYAALFAPVRPAVEHLEAATGRSVRKLTVVPHSVLHHVPFHALTDGETYVLDELEVSYAPSASAWRLSQRPAGDTLARSLVLGVTDEHIPAARDEALDVARNLPNATVCLDDEATSEALFGAAPLNDVIHLACHGLFRADNPMFSAVRLADRWVTAGDMLRLRLPGAFVALSACESGRGEAIGGDEVLGLPRALLGAGATGVLVSLWLVHDEAAAQLMATMYSSLTEGKGRAASLRSAQQELRDVRPHPYYWAPFVLLGSG